MNKLISGVFPFKDKLIEAINTLKKEGFSDMEVKMPVPDHDILDAIDHKPTPVGWFTLFGGIAGLTTGFLGPAWAHSHWGNVIGGKPIISLPPFIVIMFELTILFGALATMAGLFLLTRLPSHKVLEKDEFFDIRCTEDHYALYVLSPEDKISTAEKILTMYGAEVRK